MFMHAYFLKFLDYGFRKLTDPNRGGEGEVGEEDRFQKSLITYSAANTVSECSYGYGLVSATVIP